jgi:hypothetical protein
MTQKNNEFNVNLYYQNENDTIRTYHAYLGKTLIGDCQINSIRITLRYSQLIYLKTSKDKVMDNN